MLVTTARADPAEIEKLKARGVEVLVVPCEPVGGEHCM